MNRDPLAHYRELTLLGMKRHLSRLDRRPWSPTYGCFDREYWHYKTLYEFPRAPFQQALFALALLYGHDFEGNEFYRHPDSLAWVEGAIRFWLNSRNSDGSVNEWYAHERSFCATAFTTFAVTEAMLTLQGNLAEDFAGAAGRSLCATGEWLAHHCNPWVANQMIASCAALWNLRLLSKEKRWEEHFAKRKQDFLHMQHEEGWFGEYGGADIGYSLLSLDLLTRLWDKNPDPEIQTSIEKLVGFLSYFIRSGGTAAGDCGSRGTNHCFPYGLEYWAARGNRLSRGMTENVREFITAGRVPHPLTVDDQYSAYFYLNSFCMAACLPSPLRMREESREESRRNGNRFLEGAGLLVWETPRYVAFVSAKKGGVWKICEKGGRVFEDAGYAAVLANGSRLVSEAFRSDARAEIKENESTCQFEVETSFGKADLSLPLPRWVELFKAFTRIFLAFPTAAVFFGKLLKKRKILQRRRTDLYLNRSFFFAPEQVTVRDRIRLDKPLPVAEVFPSRRGPSVQSPSSQMFDVMSADTSGVGMLDSQAIAAQLRENSEFFHERRLDFRGVKEVPDEV